MRVHLIILTFLCLMGCSLEYMPGYRFDLFKDTPNYDLALAVRKDNTRNIETLLKTKNYDLELKEREFGQTLLFLAIANKKFKASEVLIKHGAKVDARNKRGMTILMEEMSNRSNLKMIGLLIKYGANVNAINDSVKTTPLMEACFRGDFRKIKFLISKGADPNLWVKFPGKCPLTEALIQENINVVHYLIINKNVTIPPYCFLTTTKREVTVLELLRDLMFPLNSRKHRLKMEVVDFLLKNHGLDYSKEPITEWTVKRIKQLHPTDWEEYIKKY